MRVQRGELLVPAAQGARPCRVRTVPGMICCAASMMRWGLAPYGFGCHVDQVVSGHEKSFRPYGHEDAVGRRVATGWRATPAAHAPPWIARVWPRYT